jgi:hypothetical protein
VWSNLLKSFSGSMLLLPKSNWATINYCIDRRVEKKTWVDKCNSRPKVNWVSNSKLLKLKLILSHHNMSDWLKEVHNRLVCILYFSICYLIRIIIIIIIINQRRKRIKWIIKSWLGRLCLVWQNQFTSWL